MNAIFIAKNHEIKKLQMGPLARLSVWIKELFLGKWQLSQVGMVVGTTGAGLGRIYMLLVAGETRQTDQMP